MTDEPMAAVDGELVPRSEARIPITDAGFRWGYNVYDVFRTFDGEPVALEAHVDRLRRSCRGAHIGLDRSAAALRSTAEEVVEASRPAIPDGGDQMVVMNVSGGWAVYPGADEPPPRVVVSASPIPFGRNAWKFVEGARLVVPSTRQVSPATLSPKIKHRSRMHFVVADREAKRVDPKAEPLLLDAEGNLTEVMHANVFLVDDETIRTPPVDRVLAGVSRDRTIDLARERGFAVEETPLQRYDLYNADEVFYTNTTHVVTPVTRVDGRPIGAGRPGRVTKTLLDAHSDLVGVDIVEQFLNHLPAGDRPDALRLGGDAGLA